MANQLVFYDFWSCIGTLRVRNVKLVVVVKRVFASGAFLISQDTSRTGQECLCIAQQISCFHRSLKCRIIVSERQEVSCVTNKTAWGNQLVLKINSITCKWSKVSRLTYEKPNRKEILFIAVCHCDLAVSHTTVIIFESVLLFVNHIYSFVNSYSS